jgi:hypothetical protein
LDSLSRSSFTYTFLQYPYTIEEVQPQETAIHIPLGRPFKIKYRADEMLGGEACKTDTPKVASSTYVVSEPINGLSYFNPTDPLDLRYVLFKDDVVVPLGDTDETEGVEFMPVHLGTTTITLTPTDPQLPSWTLRVIVESPFFLGEQTGYAADNQELHDYITTVAHLSGFPPQILKGWIQKETFALTDHFNPRTYRYEPGYQRIYVNNPSDPDFKSAFSSYAIQDGIHGWSNGDSLLSPFWDPVIDYRNRYRICVADCTGPASQRVYRNIERDDLNNRTITAGDIITANRSYNYTNVPSDFTAQTVISSSYGLLNMMFPTFRELIARKLRRVSLSTSMPSSSNLIDTYSNLVVGTFFGLPSGSLFLSIPNVVYEYHQKEKAVWVANTNEQATEYFESFEPLLDRHNFLEEDKKTGEKIYGRDVVSNSKNYLPRPAQCVINDGELCL